MLSGLLSAASVVKTADATEKKTLVNDSDKSSRMLAGKGGRAMMVKSVIPTLESSVVIRRTFRFQVASAITSTGVSLGNVFGALGVMCTTSNSTAFSFCSSFRLCKIIFYQSAAGSITSPTEILWSSVTDVNSKDDCKVSSTLAYDRPAKIVSVPPKNSLSGFWWNSSATVATPMFSVVNAPAGSILDLDVEYTLCNALIGNSYSISTGTVGGVYYLSLDGVTTHKLAAVGLPTTT
jgi:hypothetical protein